MKPLAPPAPPELVTRELTDTTRISCFKDLEIHLFAAREAPTVIEEIGRIREEEFRAVGAGRDIARDIDRFDTQWPWYYQLVSWDPEEREIVAVYRAIHCGWALRHGGRDALRTAHLFDFSDRFIEEYLVRSVELGRSVVNRTARRAIQGLFSIWTGLGAMTREWPDLHYFFGNVSLYRTLPPTAIEAILTFLYRYHRAQDGLVKARTPATGIVGRETAPDSEAAATSWDVAFEALQERARREEWTIPPILLSYLKANQNLIVFDTARDPDFGDALEVAIAVPTIGVNPRTRKRFIDPYESVNPGRFILPETPPEETNS